MLLISNAHAFESVELLLHWFSKTLSLLILRKTRNKLEKAQLSHSTTGTGAGAGVTWAAGGTWRHLLALPFPAGCFIPLWHMGCILALSLDNAGCRRALPPEPGASTCAPFPWKGTAGQPQGTCLRPGVKPSRGGGAQILQICPQNEIFSAKTWNWRLCQFGRSWALFHRLKRHKFPCCTLVLFLTLKQFNILEVCLYSPQFSICYCN